MNSKEYSEARTIIKPALENPETANLPDTWKLAGDIEYDQFNNEVEVEMTSLVTKKTVDEKKMYSGLLASYAPYIKADELAEQPDEKGKIKNKVRKDIAAKLKFAYPYFRNGGIINLNNKESKTAADFFEIYWNIPSLEMFNNKSDKEFFAKQDTAIQEVKYYAAISAINAKETDRALAMLKRITEEPFIENNVYELREVYELIADEYKKNNDSIAFTQALQDGAKKFPKSTYFIPNLINEYIKANRLDDALLYLDEAIKNDPANTCDFESVKASIYATRQDYEKATEYYTAAITADSKCERALEGLARNYMLQAQNLKSEALQTNRRTQTELDAKADDLYKKSIPLLESLRTLLNNRNASVDEKKQVLVLLRNAYYNLNMPEYDVISTELEGLSGGAE
ncbi:lipopolysaccharide assembly protein LapB [Dysgonomonas sp. 520]|uniref:tetratricopeptide repeat protein n=1 Tax=Dysgonomonas sp. 520 TaxID=2302931 RepID=UPI0013D44B22|nr:hypothetical protein [Dysgonomonas sp. 520]